MANNIPVETCSFVKASDLFKGLNDLWEQFIETNPNCTWGDNNRSLVTADLFIDHFDSIGEYDEEQMAILRERIADLIEGDQTYVDLEN